jgi:protein TonB
MRERLAEIQARFPWAPEDLDAVLIRPQPQDLDATAVLPRRGSTQERLDRQFLKEETPRAAVPVGPLASVAPVAAIGSTERLESRPVLRTELIPVAPPAPPPPPPAQPTPVPPSAEEPVLVAAPAPVRHLPPEAPRRKGAGRGWIAAAVAVLALAVLAAFLLRRDDVVRPAEVAEPPAAEETVPSEPPASEPPVRVEAQEPSVSPTPGQPEPPPVAVASTQPAPAVPEVAPPPVREPERRPAPEPKAPPPVERKAQQPEPKVADREPVAGRKREESPAPPVKVQVPEGRRPGQKVQDEEEITFVDPPVAVSMPAATYPKDAVGSGATGKVVVSILVNEKGAVTEARVASIEVQEGPQTPAGMDVKALFREAAVAAARRARFEPATSDGVPVTFRGELTFDFRE